MKKFVVKFISALLLICLFLEMSAFAALKGDVDGNGKISLLDARKVLRAVSGVESPSKSLVTSADMNADGKLTLSDVNKIMMKSVDIASIKPFRKLTQKTPSKNQGTDEKADFIKVTEYCGETLPASPINDKSNPLYTPLPKGTFDYIKSGPIEDKGSGKSFYILKSGRRVYAHEVKAFEGYKMPYNKIKLETIAAVNAKETKIFFALDWRVPFNVEIKPQEYEVGYNSRLHNIADGDFTGKYMDITFYYTKSAEGLPNLPYSKAIKSCKWIIDTEKKTATLRLNFKTSGIFQGYTAYYDRNNYLVISVKEPVSALKGRVIEIDPGHGGEQPGAGSGTGVYEKDITYKIAKQLKGYLEDGGAKIVFSRDNSSDVPEIEERRLASIEKNPDMVVSIHLDSSTSSASGASAYYFTSYSGELASMVVDNISKSLKSNMDYSMKNRGAHFYPFCVTRVTNCPAILVECGFISDSGDFKIQNSSKGQKYIAYGIYKGILEYYS